ncbi:NAD(+) hydrolase SARM1-like [Gigantopelta aegis]|uniref:NAD(+) hydrolase SARM1-like n=1 Tax=Gigantopelta aegis TaxID=1735272 RepID=UPI001B889FED|nr:NAD(+) hydrolase SARM1-like [Gigantopelta aegis]
MFVMILCCIRYAYPHKWELEYPNININRARVRWGMSCFSTAAFEIVPRCISYVVVYLKGHERKFTRTFTVSKPEDQSTMAEALHIPHSAGDAYSKPSKELPSTIRKVPSESTMPQEMNDQIPMSSCSKNDPYKALERSQSAAVLHSPQDTPGPDDSNLERLHDDCSGNVSECSKVYMDLSKAEAYEKVELESGSGSMMRMSSGRFLETIVQDEELSTGDLSHVYASQRSLSDDSTPNLGGSSEDLTGNEYSSSESSSSVIFVETSVCQLLKKKDKANLKSSFQVYSHSLKQKIKQLQIGSVPEQVVALQELNILLEQAWSMPVYGRDLAYSLCDIIRNEKAFDIIINNCASSNRDLLKVSANLLEQTLTTENRKQLANNGLETVIRMICEARGNCDLARPTTGILVSLFKISEETCTKVISLGGLDVIIYWCRCSDRLTLRHCAMALANLALYGGPENQYAMAHNKVPEWLFPLAFIDDDSVRYYACLSIAVLVANKEIENVVESSGTLDLVLPFLANHDPADFARMDKSHQHGRSLGWLKRLVPILSSKREEAQALAAFHFAMEAGIKSEQNRKEELYKVGCVEPLKRMAGAPNTIASKLAGIALHIIGEEIPHKLSTQVPLWTVEDVTYWVSQVGFEDYSADFETCQVDGDLLLRLTDDELSDSLHMACKITRKRFLRELKDLKVTANYTSCDPSKLADWLLELGPDFSQYTYQLLHSGVDKTVLPSLTDDLLKDCGIVNGIHRMLILQKIKGKYFTPQFLVCFSGVSTPGHVSSDLDVPDSFQNKSIDAFISYRRSNGSQLASLLKVHLQLRGFSVFIDIERLRAGKFDENLLLSVRMAKNFIIVLTPNALDRCMGDDDKSDWVHKEIVAAMDSGCKIIPLLDNFEWPSSNTLPDDLNNLRFFNGIRWIHDYQDACVDKLEQFLRGEISPSLPEKHNNPLLAKTKPGTVERGAASHQTPKASDSHTPPSSATS